MTTWAKRIVPCGGFPEAIACFRRVLELKPDYAEAYGNLGNALEGTGEDRRGNRLLPPRADLKPDFAKAHNNLGNALKDQGSWTKQSPAYRRALELKPDYAEAHNNLGIALKDQGKPDEAIACYRRALELKPDFAEAHVNLGNVLKGRGKLDEAVACYRRALELKPDYAEAHNNLGVALNDQGIWTKRSPATAGLELKPDLAAAHENLDSLCSTKGNTRRRSRCGSNWFRSPPRTPLPATCWPPARVGMCPPGAPMATSAPPSTRSLLVLRKSSNNSTTVLPNCGGGDCQGAWGRAREPGCSGCRLWHRVVRAVAAAVRPAIERGRFVVRHAPQGAGPAGLRPFDHGRIDRVLGRACRALRPHRVGRYPGLLRRLAPGHCGGRPALRPGGLLVFTVEKAGAGDRASDGFSLRYHGRYCHAEEYVRRT